jgi:hypothetical protein
MVFRDSFADLCGGEVLYYEKTALIRLLLCVEQFHAERLLEAGIYTRRCIGSPPVGLYRALPKQYSSLVKIRARPLTISGLRVLSGGSVTKAF